MRRYRHSGCDLEDHDQGEWVRFEDHQAELRAVQDGHLICNAEREQLQIALMKLRKTDVCAVESAAPRSGIAGDAASGSPSENEGSIPSGAAYFVRKCERCGKTGQATRTDGVFFCSLDCAE